MSFRGCYLTEEQRARIAARDEMYRSQRARYGAMSDETLVASTRYCMGQMVDPRWSPGEPVYDAVLWHVILPELLRRLER